MFGTFGSQQFYPNFGMQQAGQPQPFTMQQPQFNTMQMMPNPSNPAVLQQTMQSNFQFTPEEKQANIDWGKIHQADIVRIQRTTDVDTLESYLPNILNSSIEEEEFKNMKPETLLKLVQILQMSLQYFDYTQDYMDNLVNETYQETQKIDKQNQEDEVYLRRSKKKIQSMKEEIEVKKQALQRYKAFLSKKPAFKCHLCNDKFFINEDYLFSHMQRRHPQHIPMSLNHPQYQLMQNLVLTQQLQKEKTEFQMKNKQMDDKLEQQQLYDKIQMLINQNNDMISKKLDEKITQVQTQPKSSQPNISQQDYQALFQAILQQQQKQSETDASKPNQQQQQILQIGDDLSPIDDQNQQQKQPFQSGSNGTNQDNKKLNQLSLKMQNQKNNSQESNNTNSSQIHQSSLQNSKKVSTNKSDKPQKMQIQSLNQIIQKSSKTQQQKKSQDQEQQDQIDQLQEQLNHPNDKFDFNGVDQNPDKDSTHKVEDITEDIPQQSDEFDNTSKTDDQSQNNQEYFLEQERAFLDLKENKYHNQFDPQQKKDIQKKLDSILNSELTNIGLKLEVFDLEQKTTSELEQIKNSINSKYIANKLLGHVQRDDDSAKVDQSKKLVNNTESISTNKFEQSQLKTIAENEEFDLHNKIKQPVAQEDNEAKNKMKVLQVQKKEPNFKESSEFEDSVSKPMFDQFMKQGIGSQMQDSKISQPLNSVVNLKKSEDKLENIKYAGEESFDFEDSSAQQEFGTYKSSRIKNQGQQQQKNVDYAKQLYGSDF